MLEVLQNLLSWELAEHFEGVGSLERGCDMKHGSRPGKR